MPFSTSAAATAVRPATPAAKFLCPLGTGFEGHAATSWLTTTAPVTPGSVIAVRWGTYDSGDGVLDSTAILDNWRWEIDPNTKDETIPQ